MRTAAWPGLAIVVAPTAAWLLGDVAWWADLPNHFVPHALMLGLVASAAAIAARQPRWAAAFAAAVLPCLVRVLAPVGTPATAATSWSSTRILVANVYSGNDDPQVLLDLVHDESPDVVALLEVTPAWADALVPLTGEYPFFHVEPRTDCFGVAVLSRVPIADLDVAWVGRSAVPSITGTLPGDVPLLVTHPLPPVSGAYAEARDQQLAAIGAWVADRDRYVVVGDLNATPWSTAFPGVPAAQRGWTPGTWPSWAPAPLRIPIDHALIGPGLAEVGRRAGGPIGSDHLPLVVDFSVPEPPEPLG